MMARFTRRWMATTAAVATWVAAAPAWACPSCNRAIEGDPVALSFYWSTLFMISMPYLLVGTVGGGIAFFYWNAARKAAQSATIESMTWSAEGPEREGGR